MAYSALMASIKYGYVFCLCYAIVSDFRTLIIPNWVPLALVSVFVIFASVHLDRRMVLAHLAVAVVIFAIASAFFIARWMGGGDVKLLTAVALWMGPEQAGPFTLVMALLGGVLAVGLLLIKQYWALLEQSTWELPIFKRLAELARGGECPYGVAIGIAALVASPATLWAS
jgi:prepilin peptidase CpaA